MLIILGSVFVNYLAGHSFVLENSKAKSQLADHHISSNDDKIPNSILVKADRLT